MNKKSNERKNKYFNCCGKSINDIATNLLKIILVISILYVIPKGMKIYANEVNDSFNNDIKASERAAEIRNTENTDISNRMVKNFMYQQMVMITMMDYLQIEHGKQ